MTVEGALCEGEAYLLTNQMHWSHGVSRQVEAELATTHSETEAATPVTTAVKSVIYCLKGRPGDRYGGKTGGGAHAGSRRLPRKNLFASPRGRGRGHRESELIPAGIVTATDISVGSDPLCRGG